jgi:hypothetical protein
VNALTFSPDASVLVAADPGGLFVFRGLPSPVRSERPGHRAVFIPGTRRVLVVGQQGTLWDLTTGAEEDVAFGPGYTPMATATPDGRFVLFARIVETRGHRRSFLFTRDARDLARASNCLFARLDRAVLGAPLVTPDSCRCIVAEEGEDPGEGPGAGYGLREYAVATGRLLRCWRPRQTQHSGRAVIFLQPFLPSRYSPGAGPRRVARRRKSWEPITRGAVMNKLLFLAGCLIGMAVLAAASPARCLPEDGGYVTVHFHKTPGVGDFNSHPAIDLDGANLSADEVKELRRLIGDANFFDLKSSPPQSPIPPDPTVGYELKVDVDGRTNSIWVREDDVTRSLRPLIGWLTARVKAVEDKSALHVELAKSGGEAGLRFPPLTIDGAKLSAEDAETLARLIATVGFFDRPEQYPTHGADLFSYTISVEMSGRRHSVSYDDPPTELKPLIDWLSGR